MIAAGMKNGEMRPGPPCSSFECSRSITSNPPIPLATYTPVNSAMSGVIFSSAMRMAKSVAARASWMNRPIFLSSFFSAQWRGSKSRTSPAMVQSNAVASKCVIVRTPLFPARRFFQTSSVPIPRPQTSPTPVTTTRRLTLIDSLLMILQRPANYFLAGACFVM